MRYDENYFQNGKNQDEPKTIQSALLDGEQVLWSGKPQKKAFVLNNVLKMLPVALLWIVFDTFFYRYAYKNRRYDPSAGNRIFVRIFRVPPHARVDMDL